MVIVFNQVDVFSLANIHTNGSVFETRLMKLLFLNIESVLGEPSFREIPSTKTDI